LRWLRRLGMAGSPEDGSCPWSGRNRPARHFAWGWRQRPRHLRMRAGAHLRLAPCGSPLIPPSPVQGERSQLAHPCCPGTRSIPRSHRSDQCLYQRSCCRPQSSIWASVDRWPINPRAHCNLANALAKTGRLPEAIAQYETALHLQPHYVQAHVILGSALAETGRLPEAIVQYKAALRLQPDVAGGHLPGVIAQLEAAQHLPVQQHRPLGEASGPTPREASLAGFSPPVSRQLGTRPAP
jgi:tetratricopeptide (TPR) repeat protein